MTFENQQVVVPDYVMAREVSGEIVILNINSEQYFGLDEIGARMWTLLVSSGSLQETLQQLIVEYEVDPAQLENDLHELIEKLVAAGLLELHGQ